jgi:hypothetical protein
MYRRFCIDVFSRYRVDRVNFIGDIVDGHAIGFWDHDPNGRSASDEADQAERDVAVWHRTFPGASVEVGNHDARHYRLARKHGLPDRYLRGYSEVWRTPTWNWKLTHKFDGVLYEHGTGTSGKDAAYNRMMQKRVSIVMGHIHSWPGVKWHANEFDRKFGMNVGCGIDIRAYAFEYGQSNANRPVLGCGIVIDGEHAIFEPMPCGPGEKYHRSRARKRHR